MNNTKALALIIVCILVALTAAGCGGEDPSAATQPMTPNTLEPTAQALAIQTAIQHQFTLTAEAQLIYAPTQTINAAVQQTAQVNNTQTAEYAQAVTNDAYGAVTATMFARTATQDAKNADPDNMQRTVDAQVKQRFTATARAQLQIDIENTVDAAVEQTATAAELTATPVNN